MIRARFALLLLVATPLHAQTDTLTPRVSKLEGEMRAVQRKLFPTGEFRTIAPETMPAAPVVEAAGNAATSPVADLTARVDGLERQARTLTGEVEALQFKQRQLEDQLTKFRADAEYRLGGLEAGKAPADSTTTPAVKPGKLDTLKPDAAPDTAKTPTPKPGAAKGDAIKTDATKADSAKTDSGLDPVEAAWRTAYAPVAAKDYDKAEPALLDFLAEYPKATRAASAQYWLGRNALHGPQPARASGQGLPRRLSEISEKRPRRRSAAVAWQCADRAQKARPGVPRVQRAPDRLWRQAQHGAKGCRDQSARTTAKCDG